MTQPQNLIKPATLDLATHVGLEYRKCAPHSARWHILQRIYSNMTADAQSRCAAIALNDTAHAAALARADQRDKHVGCRLHPLCRSAYGAEMICAFNPPPRTYHNPGLWYCEGFSTASRGWNETWSPHYLALGSPAWHEWHAGFAAGKKASRHV